MGLIICPEDFTGRYELVKSNSDMIDEYICEYEERYLIDLLGQDLFNLFKADIVNHVPQSTIYLSIFNPFYKQINSFIVESGGIKKMLLGFVYYHYAKDNSVKQTMNGPVNQQTEVGTTAAFAFIFSRYNDSVKYYRAIQCYINNDVSDYPTFLGIYKRFASII